MGKKTEHRKYRKKKIKRGNNTTMFTSQPLHSFTNSLVVELANMLVDAKLI